MSKLASRSCAACKTARKPLEPPDWEPLLRELRGWTAEAGCLRKDLKLEDFRAALDLANRIGDLADKEDHHPDLRVSWGRLGIELRTHRVGGLTEADFVLAAKIDEICG